jgi:hypothetical protein
VHSTRLDRGSTLHAKHYIKNWDFSHNRQFCGFIFKFVWVVYGGDLTGFCQSFRKVIFKNDQQQTKANKSQKFQDMNRFDTLIRQLCPRAIQRV